MDKKVACMCPICGAQNELPLSFFRRGVLVCGNIIQEFNKRAYWYHLAKGTDRRCGSNGIVICDGVENYESS